MNVEIIQFLTELRQNNNREWFQANKSRYDSLRKGFIDEVQQLIDRIALFDPEIAGLEAKDCLFRICLLYTSPSPRDRTRYSFFTGQDSV